MTGNHPLSFGYKTSVFRKGYKSLSLKKSELNCTRDKDMDFSVSAAGTFAERLDGSHSSPAAVELIEEEPNVSTMLLNFANEFDTFEALSTPLYQTATFKQVNVYG